jgi:ClpP class serine protease
VTSEVLKRGAHAGLLDPMLPLSDEDRRALERSIDHSYDTFLRVVSAGRRRSLEEVEAVAQGRVWLGTDAVRAGLVDRLGGFEDALDAVRQRIGRGASRLRVVALRGHPRRRQSLDASPGAWGEIARTLLARFPEQALVRELLGADLATLALLRDPILAWCEAAATLKG